MRHSKAGWSVTPPSVRDKKIRRHAGDIRRPLARNREYVMEAPLPQVARPVMYHHWSPITFLHWRYPPAVMQFLLSPELTAERSGGAAWVRLASFSWRVGGVGGARRSVAVEVRGDQRSHLRARWPPEPAWRGTPATVARRVLPDLDLVAGSVCGYSPRPAVDVGDEPFCSPLARSTG